MNKVITKFAKWLLTEGADDACHKPSRIGVGVDACHTVPQSCH